VNAWKARQRSATKIDLDAYGTLTDRLGRALQRLGLKRHPRDITPPDPLEYAREYSP
jgi:hypothetical protein